MHSGYHIQPHILFFWLSFWCIRNNRQNSKSSLDINIVRYNHSKIIWLNCSLKRCLMLSKCLFRYFLVFCGPKSFRFNVHLSTFFLLGFRRWASCVHFSLGKLPHTTYICHTICVQRIRFQSPKYIDPDNTIHIAKKNGKRRDIWVFT